MTTNILPIFASSVKALLKPSVKNFILSNNILPTRYFSTKHLTSHIALMTNQSTRHLKSKPNISGFSSDGRPLTILLCWIGATDKSVNKYVKFYTDHDFDVLTVRVTPANVLLPFTVEPIIKNEILPTLLSSNHEQKIIHGISAGGFVFGHTLKHMHNDTATNYQDLKESVKLQIWDSLTGVNGVSLGVCMAAFSKSPSLQGAFKPYIDKYVNKFHKSYYEAHDWLLNKPVHAPAIFLASEIDKVATIDNIQAYQNRWESLGIPCATKIWSDTEHVKHMKKYPEEYKQTLKMFLEKNGFNLRTGVVRDKMDMGILVNDNIPNLV